MFCKHQRFLDLPMMNGWNLSVPLALQHKRTVTLSLLVIPPLLLLPEKSYVLSGGCLKKLSSQLKLFSGAKLS